ncbi:MAG: hypothetical protein NZ899_02815 [Thermoguttaceae bacterium]|nr:hypothetical protein [Thermoguttaceae bacterium]MDW8079741.1 hypothetical protein [Thermoguttaceae bacterium]
MAGFWWPILALLGGLGCAGGWMALRYLHHLWWMRRLRRACRQFHLQRERLEARFIKLAQGRAQPGAPRWADCRFEDGVTYARNRLTGEISAFVGVSIELEPPSQFAPIDREELLRSGTAVFRYDGRQWDTDGRLIYDLSPQEAIYFYKSDLKPLVREVARRG